MDSCVLKGVLGDSRLPLLSGNNLGLVGIGGSTVGADPASEYENVKRWRLEENSNKSTNTSAIKFTYKNKKKVKLMVLLLHIFHYST